MLGSFANNRHFLYNFLSKPIIHNFFQHNTGMGLVPISALLIIHSFFHTSIYKSPDNLDDYFRALGFNSHRTI